MPFIEIGYGLRRFTGGHGRLELPGETAGAVLRSLLARYPDLEPHLLGPAGQLRPWVRVYRNGQDIRYSQGLHEPLTGTDRLTLMVTVAGGS